VRLQKCFDATSQSRIARAGPFQEGITFGPVVVPEGISKDGFFLHGGNLGARGG
jgi:hypothetical protein